MNFFAGFLISCLWAEEYVLNILVDIGAGAVIIGNIVVGNHSVIGANAVILTDIPPYSIAVGVPAKIVGTRSKEN